MNHNSQRQVHCEILTSMSQMNNLWQLHKIRNFPAFIFFKCAVIWTITQQGKTALTFTKWFLVMPYKMYIFFKQMALQFSIWTLVSTQQDTVSAKPRNAQIPSWLSSSVTPSMFYQFLFYHITTKSLCSLSVKLWYSYQCPKYFF